MATAQATSSEQPVKDALKKYGLSDVAIDIIEKEELLDWNSLKEVDDKLLKLCGLTGGQIYKVRKAVPRADDEGAILKKTNKAQDTVYLCTPPKKREEMETRDTDESKSVSDNTQDIEISFCPPTKKSKGSETAANTIQMKAESKSTNVNWLKDYNLPSESTFSPRVKEAIAKKSLPDFARNELIRDVVNSIKCHTLYPTKTEREQVASTLIRRYPFLADTLGSGFGSWERSIYHRFKNIRRMGSSATQKIKPSTGLSTTAATHPSTSQGSRGGSSSSTLGQSNEITGGETKETIQEHINKMKAEMKKDKKRDKVLIKDLMNITFRTRRETINKNPEPVEELLSEYPALRLQAELRREFTRLKKDDDFPSFVDSFKTDWAPKLHTYLVNKCPQSFRYLCHFQQLEKNFPGHQKEIQQSSITMLPVVLKDKIADDFFKLIDPTEDDIDDYIENSTSPRIVASGESVLSLDTVYICMEKQIICGPLCIKSIIEAVFFLMASFYVFNVKYPKTCKNTYAFLEATCLKNQEPAKSRVLVSKLLTALNEEAGNV